MLRDVLRQITSWQVATFPTSTPESCLRHLRKEIWEVRNALRDQDTAALALEFGDLVFLAIQGNTRCGFGSEVGDVTPTALPIDTEGRTLDDTLRAIRAYTRSAQQCLEDGTMRWTAAQFRSVASAALRGIDQCGYDGEAILRMKLLENQQREWAEPDEYGVVEHIR